VKRRGFTQNKAVNKVARIGAEDEDSRSQATEHRGSGGGVGSRRRVLVMQ
jgi:hypothetical protein